ncbi:MAG: DUF2637 domain-containing protein [Aeromicrobium sp.]|uniref:DUF2637 domain-containing protein n=1 Tax=Aeromicrobium sp. TaxID=1871063 RepID=UPI0039E42998
MTGHDDRKTSRSSTWLLGVLVAVVAAIAVGAFTLSFDALSDLAVTAGIRVGLAWLLPLIVDGFIVAATLAAVVLRGRAAASIYAWATLVMFAGISVAGNALHAEGAADATALPVTVAAGVSAVPAVALLLASHLLVIVMDGSSGKQNRTTAPPRASAAPRPRPGDETAASPSGPSEPVAARPAVDRPRPDPADVGSAPTATLTAKTDAVGAPAGDVAAQIAWIKAELAAGRDLTGAEVGGQFGFSAKTGRRRLAEARAQPDSAGLRIVASQ